MGGAGSISRSLGQILEKSCLHSRGHYFGQIVFKLDQNMVLISRSSLILDGAGLKSKSLGQI